MDCNSINDKSDFNREDYIRYVMKVIENEILELNIIINKDIDNIDKIQSTIDYISYRIKVKDIYNKLLGINESGKKIVNCIRLNINTWDFEQTESIIENGLKMNLEEDKKFLESVKNIKRSIENKNKLEKRRNENEEILKDKKRIIASMEEVEKSFKDRELDFNRKEKNFEAKFGRRLRIKGPFFEIEVNRKYVEGRERKL